MLRNPRVAAFLRWLPFIIIAVNLTLLFTGVVTLAQAAVLIVVLEMCLFGVVVVEFAAMRIAFGRARTRGATRTQALMASLDACLPPAVAFVIRQELLVMLAIPRVFRRRPEATGTTELRSAGLAPPVSTGILLVAVPGCVLSLALVGGPGWLRWVLFGVSLYFALYALGFRALYTTTTHSVGGGELRVRHGATVDLSFPTAGITAVREEEGLNRGKAVDVADGALTASLFGRTNVVVEFVAPERVGFFDRNEEQVTRVRFFTDEPADAVDAIRAEAPSQAPSSEDSVPRPGPGPVAETPAQNP
ncbi:hypothetical protein [Nocardiopsis salina]|uniref:hypothetical protein n=1 Tax=Nocardiopsis salina TaxID=245836 RepID=UPI000346F1DC|nr:hypothetical protein [Nocardiopsis salina]